MSNLKGHKGITLIALVITIIVLLILAGITIAQITGQDSAPEKATEAKRKNDEGAEFDAIKVAVVGAVANGNYGEVNAESLKNELNGLVEDEGRLAIRSDNAPWRVLGKTGIKYIINQNGIVTIEEPVATVEFNSTTDSIGVGKSKKLAITCKGASGNITLANEVVFTSSNTNIATVQNDGSIKIADNATVGGTSTITVIADGVAGSNECVVTVIMIPKVGDYIEYDISYNMVDSALEYSSINGWKILYIPETTNGEGKYEGVKIFPVRPPAALYLRGGPYDWWDNTKSSNAEKMASGLANNELFKNICFDGYNTNAFQGGGNGKYKSITNNDPSDEYNAETGAVFLTKKSQGVYNLTLEEVNIALNTINNKKEGDSGYRTLDSRNNILGTIFRPNLGSIWGNTLLSTPYNQNLTYIDSNGSICQTQDSYAYNLIPVVTLKPVNLTWNSTNSYWKVD